ncbi:hypothetical protein DLB95_22865 [Salmonella enterica subsp. diarizonae]|uniref:Fimbrial protein n=1 Tax=Salmonella diarizonae TaxID=59204 RepID=A0A5Y3W9P7_SALDZ|nr:hypothetical protein [Salmonella enterica subsp. diarizonae]EBG1930937.1 hypothetical protein [Salmonella enterica]EBS2926442.1 hypothetical protein [Salmonella enterica subsp. enterica serovar Hvittingfoss]EBZ8403925.1 hypothetical protein [Salmonella enterica subsp. enterica serovar Muenchen]ECF1925570.1 hypothetical protein [Salmonella enterica subsp. enterica serovar Newport]
MKITLFTLSRIVALLVIPVPYALSESVVTGVFNLEATLQASTCLNMLDTTTDIDFGGLALRDGPAAAEKTMNVNLTLDCTDSPFPPVKVGIGFGVTGGKVSPSDNARLEPASPSGLPQSIVYYKWAWADGINDAVVQSPGGSLTGLIPGTAVNLKDTALIRKYQLKQEENRDKWVFPLSITRKLAAGNPAAGVYSASVKVDISYE